MSSSALRLSDGRRPDPKPPIVVIPPDGPFGRFFIFPEIMARRIFGFTLSWFILGVLFFPFVWVIAWIFIKKSIALEEEEPKL